MYNQAINFSNNVYAIVQSIISNNNTCKKLEEQKPEDYLDSIKKLVELKESGVISEKEFKETKKRILSKL